MRSGTVNQARRRNEGAVLVVVCLFLPILLGFCVATVDVGLLQAERSRLQAVADLALLSALGNVDWDGVSSSAQEVDIHERINQVLNANGLADDFFGVPTFTVDPDTDNVVGVQLSQQIPVNTFFWSFVQPNTPTVNVLVQSAVAVEYGAGGQGVGQTNLSGLGMFGLDAVSLSGNGTVGTYRSDPDDPDGPIPGTVGKGKGNQVPDTHLWGGTGIGSMGEITIAGAMPNVIGGELFVPSTGDIDNQNGRPVRFTSECGDYMREGDASGEHDGVYTRDWIGVGSAELPIPLTPADDYENPTIFDRFGNVLEIETDQPLNPQIDGDMQLQAGGTYVFSDLNCSNGSIQLFGSSEEPTTVYITGNVHLNGRVSVNGNIRLIVVGDAGDDETVIFNGASDTYADIYAPQRIIRHNGTAHFYGRLIGREVRLIGNGSFYYDANLGDIDLERVEGGDPAVTIPVHLVPNST